METPFKHKTNCDNIVTRERERERERERREREREML